MNSNLVSSPQIENGYTRIANELLEAISIYPFSGGELKVVLVILRYTYGYNRKVSNISLTELAKKTALTRRHISNVLKLLKATSVIIVGRYKNRNILGINKNYLQWKLWISDWSDMRDFPKEMNGFSLQ